MSEFPEANLSRIAAEFRSLCEALFPGVVSFIAFSEYYT